MARFYLAGKMSGIPQFNFPLFDRVADALRERGLTIVSPAELDDPETRKAALASPDGAPGGGSSNGETWGDFLARDVKLIADEVDGVICLPGWTDSKGAVLETFVAVLCGKPVYELFSKFVEDPHAMGDVPFVMTHMDPYKVLYEHRDFVLRRDTEQASKQASGG